MTTTKTQPRKPIAYSGTGSAVDFYQNQSNKVTQEPVQKELPNWGLFDKNNTQHRTILSLLHQAQWTKQWNDKEVPDIKRLSDFLHSNKSPVNKALKKMTTLELSKIIIAFEGIVSSKYR